MTENYQDMTTKLTKIIIAIAILGFAFTSCELPDYDKVDTISNVYKELSATTNGQVDTLVNGVLSIEELKNFDNPLKVVKVTPDDEMLAIRALLNVSIEDVADIDSLKLHRGNMIFLYNKNNVTIESFTRRDTTKFKKGYTFGFPGKGEKYDEIEMFWRQVAADYKPMFNNDSITQTIKNRIELSFNESLEFLDNLKYIVLVDDALLIPPVIDYYEEAYLSGYVVTHLYVYDLKTFEKIAQTMVITSSGDEISYRSKSDTASINANIINKKLREDLLKEKRHTIDSIFNFK